MGVIATGKWLVEGSDGRLFMVKREVDPVAGTAYTLHALTGELVDAYQHKYEAIRAVD